jgi:hypothetical protein
MIEAVRTSETSVDNHFTRQYNPEDSSEHHTRRRENLKSHNILFLARYTNSTRCNFQIGSLRLVLLLFSLLSTTCTVVRTALMKLTKFFNCVRYTLFQ